MTPLNLLAWAGAITGVIILAALAAVVVAGAISSVRKRR